MELVADDGDTHADDANMHQVPAIAPALAYQQLFQGDQRGFGPDAPAGSDAVRELLQHAQKGQETDEKAGRGKGVRRQERQGDQCQPQGSGQRQSQLAPDLRWTCEPPTQQRSHPHEQQQEQEEGAVHLLEIGCGHRNLLLGEEFAEDGEVGAPERGEGDAAQQPVVGQEGGLARKPGGGCGRFGQQRAPHPQEKRKANHGQGHESHEVQANRAARERMHAGHDVAAGGERAKQYQKVGQADHDHVPQAHRAALLLDNQAVQKGGGRQPGQQGGVLDRIPGPVAAPTQFHVGPLAAHQDANREEQPRHEGPAAQHPQPDGVHATDGQGRHGQRERHRQSDITQVEHDGMDDHPVVLQQWIEARTVRRREGDALERVGRHHHQQQEKRQIGAQDGRSPGGEVRQGPRHAAHGEERATGQYEGPEQEAAGLTSPEGRKLVEEGQCGLRRIPDIENLETVLHQQDPEDDGGAGHQQDRGPQRPVARHPPGAGTVHAGTRPPPGRPWPVRSPRPGLQNRRSWFGLDQGQELLHGLRREGSPPGPRQVAGRIYEEGFRNPLDAVGTRHQATGVPAVGIGEAERLDEAQGCRLLIQVGDTQDRNAQVLVPLPCLLKERRFVAAGIAPAGPEVQDNPLSLQVCQG